MLDLNNNNGTTKTPRVLAITGGKGGVGKTSLAVNLAISLSRNGAKVCLFDADTALGNINIMLGISPAYTLEHLLSGEKTIQEILVSGPEDVHIVPGASGAAQCAELDVAQQHRLIQGLESIESQYDYLVIDTAAGISPTVLHFIAASQVASVVITPEPTSLTDAFSLLKVLRRRGYRRTVQVIVNMAQSSVQAEKVYRRFSSAVAKYLDLTTEHLGSVWMDESMRTAVTLQRPVALFPKNDPSARSFYRVAERVESIFSRSRTPKLAFSAYWQKVADKQLEKAKLQIKEIQRKIKEQQEKDAHQPDPESFANVSTPELVESKPPIHKAPIKVIDLKRDNQDDFIRVEESTGHLKNSSETLSSEPAFINPAKAESKYEDSILELAEKLSQSEPEADEVESFVNSVKLNARSSSGKNNDAGKTKLSSPDHRQELAEQLASLSISAQVDGNSPKPGSDYIQSDSGASEANWLDVRQKLNSLLNDPNTTPEQVTTILSTCIMGFGKKLGNSSADILHVLLNTINPRELTLEQRILLKNDYEALLFDMPVEQQENKAKSSRPLEDDSIINVQGTDASSNISSRKYTPEDETLPQKVSRKVSYDAKGFGTQESLAERIKSTGDQPLENFLESIKYASLVGTPGDEEAS